MSEIRAAHTPLKVEHSSPKPSLHWFRSARFAILWSLAVAALSGLQFHLEGRDLADSALATIKFLTAGSFLGALFAYLFTEVCSRFRPQRSARFAAMFISLTIGTVSLSAFLHFLDYRTYYAQTHSSVFKYWVGEQIMTGAGSLYIFLVQVTPLLLPWGVLLLLGASWASARK